MKKTFREKFKEAEALDQVMMVTMTVATISFAAAMIVSIFKLCGVI